MNEVTTNGLGELMVSANATCVGVGLIIFTVLSIWIVTKGIPKLLDRADAAQQRSDAVNTESRKAFLAALTQQTDARTEAAKGGHEAALQIANNLRDLGQEIRRSYNGSRNADRVANSREWRSTLESGVT